MSAIPADKLSDLRRAMAAGEIVPYFQPLVCLRTGEVDGFELLARWRRPAGMTILPDQFIPVAEEHGLIDVLTDILLRQGFTVAARWPERVRLSVNLSPLQLHDRGLPGRVRALSEQTGFSLRRLTVEITESAPIETTDPAQTIILELKEAGAQIALDDFGTGFSSLRRLQALPVDTLKVDAGFVQAMTHRRDSRKIVAAVIGLGLSLGLLTVAEGVETREQADMLKVLGCDAGQGWWFGRPVPAEEATRGLIEGRWAQGATHPSVQFASDMAARLEASPSRRLAELNALYDGAPIALGLLDSQLRYISLNRRLAEMHDMTAAEHIGRTVAEVAPDVFRRIEPYLRRAQSGQAVIEQRVALAPDAPGEQRVYVASYYPVRDEADEVVGVSLAVIDVTGRQGHRAADQTQTEPALRIDARLSARQVEVLRLLAEGRSIKDSARSLGLGVGTVKAHLARAYRVLGAHNRVEAIARAGLAKGRSIQ